MGDSAAQVLLYGATGYTGKLIAQELERRRIPYRIAGRNEARLQRLSNELASGPVVDVAPIDDGEALRRAMRQASAVISAAGPYVTAGPPVLDAAIATKTPFLDVTGEQTFLRHAWDRRDEVERASIPVLNGMGFDVVPSDVAAHIACTAMDRVARVDLCIETDARLSGGTRRSMAAAGGRGWYWRDGRWRAGPPGRFERTFRFPADVPRFYPGHDKEANPDATQRSAIFVPWGDCITAPRSTNAAEVRTFFVTSPANAKRFHRMWPLTGAIASTPGIRDLVSNRLGKRAKPSGIGPDQERRSNSRFAILAEATSPDGHIQHGFVTGKDPYGLTAAAVVEGAARVLAGEVGPGVLTPSQAFPFGPFFEALPGFDLEWRARSVNAELSM